SGEHVTLNGTTDHDQYGSLAALKSVVQANLGIIRTEFGRFERQVSGYCLEHLLPENHFDVTRFLAGSEGTLAVIIGATVRLVADAPQKIMIVLGYPTMADAADAAPLIVDHLPIACEGLDRRIVDVVRRTRGETAVPPLPRGNGWMLVELVGEDLAELRIRADALLAASGASDGVVVTDPAQALALWKIREDGAGLAGISLARPAYPGWEDAAVPAEHLGSYLRDFDQLLIDHGLDGLPYGHFGDGCVHVRIDFPLTEEGGARSYRAFVEEAAQLVAGYGGSLSGEHGDGRARSQLLPAMYSPAALEAFGQIKAAFDPENMLNPGVLVEPRPVDADLRAVSIRGRVDDFAAAVHRCSGVGKCLANTTAGLGVMC
ncbi:MAG: FAD-binding oxidoreductase, partial [Propionibacteriaceae bacterium]